MTRREIKEALIAELRRRGAELGTFGGAEYRINALDLEDLEAGAPLPWWARDLAREWGIGA